jgi:hypothetical protein
MPLVTVDELETGLLRLLDRVEAGKTSSLPAGIDPSPGSCHFSGAR